MLFGVMFLLFISCEKFEDGGYHYASHQNLPGVWTFQQVEVGGIQLSDSAFYARYRNSWVEFEKGSMVHFCWKDVDGQILEEEEGTYVLNYNKRKLSIVFDVYPLVEDVYIVKRLTKNELWMDKVSEDETVAIQLTKTKK